MTRKLFVIIALAGCALAVTGCKKKEQAKEAAPTPVQQTAAAGSANYTFESSVDGWTPNGKIVKIEQATDQKHGGSGSLKISATASDKLWNLAVSPRFSLESGKKYKLTGWMYVESWNNAKFPPLLKFGIYQNGKFKDNAFTSKYDLNKTKEWQKLENTFTAPEGAPVDGYIAMEKATQDNITAVIYLDDIKLEPAK